MIENDAEMRAKVAAKALDFAGALGKLKAKEEQHQGCELTADEVSSLIWAIRNLGAGAKP